MSDYVPCDGCPAEATHHLCEECCHAEPDAISKENAELRESAALVEARLMELQGPECEDTNCPDYDGNHPYHGNAVEEFWVRVQDTWAGREDAVPAVGQWRRDLVAQRERAEAAEAFKRYVHERLDAAGIPVDPPGPHRDAGCRIGQRLDALFALAFAKVKP